MWNRKNTGCQDKVPGNKRAGRGNGSARSFAEYLFHWSAGRKNSLGCPRGQSIIFSARFIFIFIFSPVFFFAQEEKSWNVINYDDGYKNFRGGSLGLAVRGDTIYTAYITWHGDRVCYCFSTDAGKNWKTEIVEDSTDKSYQDLPGLREPLDSSAWYYERHRHPLLFYSGSPWRTRMLIDPSGTPHIFFLCAYSTWKLTLNRQWIKHAWRENGTWKTEVIQESAAPDRMFYEYSPAIDRKGNLSIVYSFEKNGCRLARKEKGKWVFHAVNKTPAYGVQLQIGKTGMLYCLMGLNDSCIYTTSANGGETWRQERIPGAAWWEVDMALSSDGTPHIVYKDLQKGMMYGVRKKDGWKLSLIYSEDPAHSARPLIVIDNCDQVHVGFFNHYSGLPELDPLYWAFSTDDGATWKITEVDTESFNGSSGGTPGMCVYENRIYFNYELAGYRVRLSSQEFICGAKEDPLHSEPKKHLLKK